MKKNKQEKVNAFAKFSSIGIQMAVLIVGGVYLGQYLDNKLEIQTPWMTILFSLIGVFAGLYLVIKEVVKFNK
jgi:F0F1-type ATP synthase assembly protein I